VDVVRTTATRVSDLLRDPDRAVLVLGGDCTVGIGTVAGAQAAIGGFALAYFDLHSDLNTQASSRDGAPGWMALAHMLSIDGTEPKLAAAAGQAPLLTPEPVVLFAHGLSHATRFERAEIERLGVARTALEDVEPIPRVLRAIRSRCLPPGRSLSHPSRRRRGSTSPTPRSLSTASRNTGLKLHKILSALRVLAADPGLVAITLT
jgi:arginase